jgi:hypothetical protein
MECSPESLHISDSLDSCLRSRLAGIVYTDQILKKSPYIFQKVPSQHDDVAISCLA